ncbi:MAG: hypothetical protein HFJ20_07995 [Clostridia bacterium]|nr:hypothetical protein [Clostridia bacterium]
MSKKKDLWKEKKYGILSFTVATLSLLMITFINGGIKAMILMAIVGITCFMIMRDGVLNKAFNIKKICVALAAAILLITMNFGIQVICVAAAGAMEAYDIFHE